MTLSANFNLHHRLSRCSSSNPLLSFLSSIASDQSPLYRLPLHLNRSWGSAIASKHSPNQTFTRKIAKMPPTSTLLRAARPAFRAQKNTFFTSQATRTRFQGQFRQKLGGYGKRWQSTAAPTAGEQVGWFKRMWDSPIGLKTVHFW